MNLLNLLDKQQLVVPTPVAKQDGTFIQVLNAPEGIRYAVLFKLVPGTAPVINQTTSHQYGQAVGELHATTEFYPKDVTGFHFAITDMVDEPLERSESLFNEHINEHKYLLDISKSLKQATDKLPRTGAIHGICHGDLNSSNFHVYGEANWSLIDFEYFG
jgi:Ser/Thr protein kinase RdoA (MazF antagonist)